MKKRAVFASAGVTSMTPRRGRPRKFNAPSRAVTLTLPEHVLGALNGVDRDLSRAIVRLTQPAVAKGPHPPAEVVHFGRRAVVVVTPTRTLEERTGIFLVPMPDGRALISFDESTTIASLELKVRDALDDRRLAPDDRRVFQTIHTLLKSARTRDDVVLHERKIIVLESRSRRRG